VMRYGGTRAGDGPSDYIRGYVSMSFQKAAQDTTARDIEGTFKGARAMRPRAQAPRADLKLVKAVVTDLSRDALLTDFGKKTLDDRYLLPGESYQDMFARVATIYADDAEHAQR